MDRDVQVQITNSPARVVGSRSPLRALAARRPERVPAGATLAHAATTMRTRQVSSLLVDDHAGLLTERDVTRAVADGLPPTTTVDRVATPRPLAVAGSISVVEAAGVMLNEQVRHLLIVEDEEVIGVVSMRDLFAVLLQDADPHLWLTSLRIVVDEPAEIWLG